MEPERCYTLPSGECISPFDCIHGDGVPLEDFIRCIQESSVDATRLNKLEECLCYMMVRTPRGVMISLPNSGDGWKDGRLRRAIDDAITQGLI